MKKLIHEIHRRSMWQVLGIYLAGAWLMLQFVDTLAGALGLPDWSASLALFLLIVGLPIVLATAFVQQGMTTKEPQPEPQSLVGADETPARPAVEPAAHHRLFTWRNAIRGGVVAFALLGILTAGYLFLRSAGIGPAGTLVAQGVLEEGAEVVLANFDSADSDLAEVVTGALRIDLLQSPVIKLVPTSELSNALRRMQRDDDVPITSEIARELATREGYGAVIEGDIGMIGSGYVLTASILGGQSREPLAAFRATAKSEDDLIDAIESLSRDIRDKAGESLRSVQRAPGLVQVTTSSLEALRIYTRAETVEMSGDAESATEQYERAIELDPEFAMAHRKLGVNLTNLGIRRSDAVAAFGRAFELRDRLPESERYQSEARYAEGVTGDRDAAIRAYQNLLEIDPTSLAGLNNLGRQYRNRGRLDEAESLYERVLDEAPIFVGYAGLAEVRYLRGDDGAAAATLDTAIGVLPGAAPRLETRRVDLTLAVADYDRADSLLSVYRERFTRPRDLAAHANHRFLLAATAGRLRDSETYLAEVVRLPGRTSNPMAVAANRARISTLLGNGAEAVRVVTDALDEHRDSLAAGDRFYDQLVSELVAAGNSAEAERLSEEWEREIPEDELGERGADGRRLVAAQLAFAARDFEEAERLWQIYESECPGRCAPQGAFGLARVHDEAGDMTSAITEYERYLETRGPRRANTDAWVRASTIERLGQLYDQQSDLENAAKYYAMFVELWAEADEELQPRVRAAQARLEEILNEIG